jgi:hypothetical protein
LLFSSPIFCFGEAHWRLGPIGIAELISVLGGITKTFAVDRSFTGLSVNAGSN